MFTDKALEKTLPYLFAWAFIGFIAMAITIVAIGHIPGIGVIIHSGGIFGWAVYGFIWVTKSGRETDETESGEK